jgi:hypothetical protein
MGGDIRIDEGAHVPGAGTFRIGGSEQEDESGARHGGPGGKVERFIKDALFRAAVYLLLFVIGLIFLGAAPERLGALQRIIVREPFRVVATGLLTVAGAIVGCIVLAITIIGIPLAVVLGLATFVVGYVGLVAAASVIGAVLPIPSLKDRRVLQLAAGLAILFVASLLPWGTLFAFMAACIGLGAIVLTRFRKTAPGEA